MYKFTEKMEAKTRVYTPEEEFSRKEMETIYDNDVDHQEYPWFENWMYDMRRNALVIQTFPSESELKEYARECAKKLTYRCYENGNSEDVKVNLPAENEIVYDIIYGTLNAIRFNNTDSQGFSVEEGKIHACIDTAEFIMYQLNSSINTYDTIFLPIYDFYKS